LGVRTLNAMAAKRLGETPISTSGSSSANLGSSATKRAKLRYSRAIRSLNIAAISLNARY
jgi:hypothetical protein